METGLYIDIVQDEDPLATDPQQNDNAGTIVYWGGRDPVGDDQIAEPDLMVVCDKCDGDGTIDGSDEPTARRYDQRTCPKCQGERYLDVSLGEWFRETYDAALTVGLWFYDHGARGARIYESDDPNAAIFFTKEEVEREWHGDPKAARRYAEARIQEYDYWLQGYVWCILIREGDEHGEVLDSCCGFIGDPDRGYIVEQAEEMRDAVAAELEREQAEAHAMACRDILTI